MAYVEVDQRLFKHPKTLHLESLLGERHPWHYLVLLWSLCLSDREDGVLRKMTPAQVAREAQYEGDPDKFVAALMEAGFLDRTEEGLRVHGWEERYRDLLRERKYHREKKAAQRAKERSAGSHAGVPPGHPTVSQGDTTGTAPPCPRGVPGVVVVVDGKTIRQDSKTIRQDSKTIRQDSKTIRQDSKTGEPAALTPVSPQEDDSRPDRPMGTTYREVMRGWNETAEAGGLSKVERLTDARKRTIKARVKEYGLDSLLVAFGRVGASDFLTGRVEGRDGRQPFRASFDWTLAPSNLAKVMEGTYDNSGKVRRFPKDKPATHETDRELADRGICPRCHGPNPEKWTVCRACLQLLGAEHPEDEAGGGAA